MLLILAAPEHDATHTGVPVASSHHHDALAVVLAIANLHLPDIGLDPRIPQLAQGFGSQVLSAAERPVMGHTDA